MNNHHIVLRRLALERCRAHVAHLAALVHMAGDPGGAGNICTRRALFNVLQFMEADLQELLEQDHTEPPE